MPRCYSKVPNFRGAFKHVYENSPDSRFPPSLSFAVRLSLPAVSHVQIQGGQFRDHDYLPGGDVARDGDPFV